MLSDEVLSYRCHQTDAILPLLIRARRCRAAAHCLAVTAIRYTLLILLPPSRPFDDYCPPFFIIPPFDVFNARYADIRHQTADRPPDIDNIRGCPSFRFFAPPPFAHAILLRCCLAPSRRSRAAPVNGNATPCATAATPLHRKARRYSRSTTTLSAFAALIARFRLPPFSSMSIDAAFDVRYCLSFMPRFHCASLHIFTPYSAIPFR